MLYQAGLGEYLDRYIARIDADIRAGQPPVAIQSPEDFLPFVDDQTYEVGKTEYSNVGLLLVGLSLEHLTGESFDGLLQAQITGPAHMECFATQRPPRATYNPADPIAPHLCGGPAGGQWTTAQDISRFGAAWTSAQMQDPYNSRTLAETFGSEFMPEPGKIYHDGILPSSTTELRIYPDHHTVIFVMSNKDKPRAWDVGENIEPHLLHE